MVPPSFNVDCSRTVSPSGLYMILRREKDGECTSYYNTWKTEHSSPLRTRKATDSAIVVPVLTTLRKLHMHW